jgi:hypothetical protein
MSAVQMVIMMIDYIEKRYKRSIIAIHVLQINLIRLISKVLSSLNKNPVTF